MNTLIGKWKRKIKRKHVQDLSCKTYIVIDVFKHFSCINNLQSNFNLQVSSHLKQRCKISIIRLTLCII